MPLESIVYVSSAVGRLTDADLEALLSASKQNNKEHGVTGALLYHDGSFCQYIEGPSAGLNLVYGRIQRSRLHHGMIELVRSTLARRACAGWVMGFTRVPESFMLQLSHASWKAGVEENGDGRSEGMDLLREFWRLNR